MTEEVTTQSESIPTQVEPTPTVVEPVAPITLPPEPTPDPTPEPVIIPPGKPKKLRKVAASTTPPTPGNPWHRRLRARHYLIAGLIAVVAGAGIGATLPKQHTVVTPTITITPVASPSASLAPLPTATGKTGAARLYPNPLLTPGKVLPVTTQQVCQPGYASSVRSVSVAEKQAVYTAYNLSYPQAAGAFEVDHFISLELGGSNDITNLWPEPALPVPGFHQKDQVENYLHSQVCAGRMTLQEAQREISTDWYAVFQTRIP